MKVILSSGGVAAGEVAEAAGVVVINARRAERLRQAASNCGRPALLDPSGTHCQVILWDEVGGRFGAAAAARGADTGP